MVDFPSSDSHITLPLSDPRFQRLPHLPFRRISLPSAPNLIQRQSIVSTASFDSLPEEGHVPGAVIPAVTPAVIKSAVRGPKHRPASGEVTRRPRRSHSQLRPIDQQRESKRRKVINEFHETEKSYVDGLDLIYNLFLTPIIASLDTPTPLLDRADITSIFSNFIDIWNLHHSFYSSLTTYLSSSTSLHPLDILPALSPVLLSHFPYLSLYTPFVTSFPDALSAYSSLLSSNTTFAAFITEQEADPRCGKLKFRDWLLTVVQRCPRYLLLLKDLIGCTHTDDPEYASLTAVHTLVSKITMSLNTSLHTHAQTLALLALQRNTPNLPFRLITPGRTFLKRGPLLQVEGSTPREREFLLFSDYLIWLANADGDAPSDRWDRHSRPPLVRTRSKSDADLPRTAEAARRRDSLLKFKIGASPKKKVRHASSGIDERWVYKGHVDLVDLEVVISPALEAGNERRFEILSPQLSFAVYASGEEEREEWCSAIRNAKSSLLVSLNVMQPNSTLTSSVSTHHLRRQLRALPYSPDEDDGRQPKRGRVDHFVPAIWIPDGKTENCMRCGRTFGWRRRRHHCRLCGRCVCGGCSGKTFYVMDPTIKDVHKPARACEACYETVFPLLDTQEEPPVPTAGATHSHFTLSGLRSMPSFVLSESHSKTPSALMAIDLESPRRVPTVDDEDAAEEPYEPGGIPAIRVKPIARPRSYVQILEDFEEHESADRRHLPSPSVSRYSHEAPDEREEDALEESVHGSFEVVDSPASAGSSLPSTPRKENTARRHKRFSLPAVGVQTSPVTARPSAVGEGIGKRFSLMLGRGENARSGTIKDGAAINKLYELLGRGKRT
ncbi:hypothetical protein CERSUDRAFT_118620 [Gelatoporia subvermispora B]|uniref:FYVE-type domain-containing protein n=1 Tax=Ceriporiopsis subvermispora (strain B) TaxID=914234 RepID=M2R137_CERS8|nr:hypothetical protein CERSUDRAFT_118620 [Gelatoporia subvermispora B]